MNPSTSGVPLDALPLRLTNFSHGGGCGCKIAPGILSEILRSSGGGIIPPELMVGIETADDAAVYKLNDEQALIATTRSTSAASPRPTRSATSTRWEAGRSAPW